MKRGWALIGILFVAPFIAGAWIAWDSKGTGFGVSPAEANAVIHQRFAVPASARDVCFVSSPRFSEVTFLVEPGDFDAWIRRQGFRATAISPDEPAVTFTRDAPGSRQYDGSLVDEGIRFDQPGRCGIAGVYDRRRRLCYATFSCR
jgi:hypothetical protein